MTKLDIKDWKILHELDSNSRQSCSRIGKKIGVSSEVVNYRIKKLEQSGIITHYQIITNLSALSIIQFKLCLSLQHIQTSNLEPIIEKLKKMPEIKWIVSCRGSWDLIISLETSSILDVNTLKDEVLSNFEGFINQKSLSILVEAETFNRGYFLNLKSFLGSSRAIMKPEKQASMDDLDWGILKELSKNARRPLIEIAEKLKTTPRIINYRIKQLEKKKIILGYKIAISYEKLGIKFFKTFIYLDNPKKERIKTLTQHLSQHPNCIHNVKVLGSWDLEPEFEVRSEQEFNKILSELKDSFSDIIKTIDVITISQEHKFVYL